MSRLASTFRRAAAAHRDAMAHLAAAERAASGGSVQAPPELRDLAAQLRMVADEVAPGWLSGPLTDDHGAGSADPSAPIPVRLGLATVDEDEGATVDEGAGEGAAAGFPALVPLLGGAHLAIDADARDPQVAALLRALTVRLLAATPAGSLTVLPVDQAALGATFLPLHPLVEAGVMAAPATDADGVHRLLAEAEQHARTAPARRDDAGWLLVVAASPPGGELARLAALTHTGPAARVCVLLSGYPPRQPGMEPPPLGGTTQVRLDGRCARIGEPPGEPFSSGGRGLAARVTLDADPAAGVVASLADRVRHASALRFADLVPARHWAESSVDGLRTTVGRSGRTPVVLAFDDATPHWLVGGRTGAGKTVFLLDVLYGLAARYSPDELAFYLLDFKEGISFTEFVPTSHDPSWIPHARAVGIESDREYGVAVLRELRREMNRRAGTLKQAGVTKLSDLRGQDIALPRVVAVIDEFHVLFAGNDALAREATALLEELARKGRSYGIHLVLASQTVSGVEALYGKADSIFGQFPLRIALPGGGGVLDILNDAAAGLALGTAIVNPAAGIAAANTAMAFPDAHAGSADVTALRHALWDARTPGSPPPAVFRGYDAVHIEDDPTFRGLRPGGRRPLTLVGRTVDVGLSTAVFPLDAAPGRHLAILGTNPLGADILHGAALSLGRQHAPGTARFFVAPLVAAGDEVADETVAALRAAGHPVTTVDAPALRDELGRLAGGRAGTGTAASDRTYLVVFGMDGASAALSLRDPTTFRSGLDDLQAVLRQGPAYGVHLLGWWRGLRRLADDIGGSGNREDVACLVVLNVLGQDLGVFLGRHDLSYAPRPNRALLVDRHDQRVSLIVPFVRPGRLVDEVL